MVTQQNIEQVFGQLGLSPQHGRQPLFAPQQQGMPQFYGQELDPFAFHRPEQATGTTPLFGTPGTGRTPLFAAPQQSELPGQLADFWNDIPAATDRAKWWQHLMWGIAEPVTGTAQKLGETGMLGQWGVEQADKGRWDRPDPHTMGGTIARAAGNLLGWAGLLGIGIVKAPFAAVGAGVALMAKTAGATAKIAGVAHTLGKFGALGATMGAQRAWLDDEPVAKEALKGAAFSMAFAGGLAGIGHLARKAGVIKPDTFQMLQKNYMDRYPMLDPRDAQTNPEIMQLMTRATKSTSSAVVQGAMRSAEKSKSLTIPADLFNRSLTTKQKGLYKAMQEAKTFGEQADAFSQLKTSVNRQIKSTLDKYEADDLFTLMNKLDSAGKGKHLAIQYADRRYAVQELESKFREHIGGIFSGHVKLPALNLVRVNVNASEITPKGLAAEAKRLTVGQVDSRRVLHPEMDAVFDRLQKQMGVALRDVPLKDMPKAARDEVSKVISSLKAQGHDPVMYKFGSQFVGVPEGMRTQQLKDFLVGMKKLPESKFMVPDNLDELITMQRPMNALWQYFTPVREVFGKNIANVVRQSTHDHAAYVERVGIQSIKRWQNQLGLYGRDFEKAGVRIGKALEGTWTDKANEDFSRVGQQIAALMQRAPQMRPQDLKGQLTRLGKQVGVSDKRAQKVFQELLKLEKKGAGGIEGVTKEQLKRWNDTDFGEYAAHWLKQEKLYANLGKPTDAFAKEVGLANMNELKVFARMRKQFDKLFKEAGFNDYLQYEVNFLPRFKAGDKSSTSALLHSLDQLKGSRAEKLRGAVRWVNELNRTAAGNTYDYDQNAFSAYSRYVMGMSKQRHFEPTFEVVNAAMKKQKMAPNRQAMWRQMQDHLIGQPTKMEASMNQMVKGMGEALGKTEWKSAWGKRPSAQVASLLAEMQIYGGLAFNPFTAVKNLTQKGLALSSITDDGNPLKGLAYMAKAQIFKRTAEGKRWAALNPVKDNRMFTEGLHAQTEGISNIHKAWGNPDMWANVSKKMKDKAMWMFKKSDMSNVDDTFLAKMLYLKEKGIPFADAANISTQTTMATQFMYGFDSPMLYKSTGPLGPFGKQLGIFMSWPMNWAQLLYNQGTSGEIQRAFTTITTMAVMAEILDTTRMNFQSIHPFETARGILPLAMLEGDNRRPNILRVGAAGMEYVRALGSGDPYAVDVALDNFKRRATVMVPGGVMTRRALELVDLTQNEWRKLDHRGRLQYTVTPNEAGRAFFGPTLEARWRHEDWQQVSQMDADYRRSRAMAVDSFIEGDYETFLQRQQELVWNFGRWIQPNDIARELELRQQTARERQLQGLPEELRVGWFELMQERRGVM